MKKIEIINGYKINIYKYSNIYLIENILNSNICDEIIKIIETLPLKHAVYASNQNVDCYYTIMHDIVKENDDFYYSFNLQNAVGPTSGTDRVLEVNTKKSNSGLITTNRNNGIKNEKINEYIEIINNKLQIISEIFKKVNTKIKFENHSGYCLRKICGETREHSDGINMSIPNIYSINLQNADVLTSTFVPDFPYGNSGGGIPLKNAVHATGGVDRVLEVNGKNINDTKKMVRNATVIFTLNDNYEGGIFHFTNQDLKLKLPKGSAIIFPPFWTNPHKVSNVENNTYRYTINTWTLEQTDIDI